MNELYLTKAEEGSCLTCRLRAFFVSGEWWCKNQHPVPSAEQGQDVE